MAFTFTGDPALIAKINQLAGGLFIVSVDSSGTFAAVVATWYILTVNGGTVTLPAAPNINDRIRFASGSSAVIAVTLNPNGKNINSAAGNKTLSGTEVSVNVELVYVSATVGWRIVAQPAALTPGQVILNGGGIAMERAIRRGKLYASGF